MNYTADKNAEPFVAWALVELFGHTRMVGKVSEATIGGCNFVRVDVPEHNDRPGFTRFLGNGAIYGITVMTEESARALMDRIHIDRPIAEFDIRAVAKTLPPTQNKPQFNFDSPASYDDPSYDPSYE